jgi:hypothetical protein
LALLGLFVLSSFGCTPIEPQKKVPAGPKFAVTRMTSDAVGLEVGLLQLDQSQVESFEEFWNQLDHQKLEQPVRQRLDQNGIRAGLMPSTPPGIFLELVKPRPWEYESLDLVQQQMAIQGKLEPKSRMLKHQQVVNRRSDTYRVETSEVHPQAQWEIRRDQQSSVGSAELVQGIYEITTSPQSDGTARIRLTPRINYGPVQNTIGAGEQEFTYDSRQAGQLLSELGVEVVLRPGETIVMAPTPDRTDLGKLFFDSIEPVEDPHRTPSHLTHRVLLVRLVQTQLDDLFGQGQSIEPLIGN